MFQSDSHNLLDYSNKEILLQDIEISQLKPGTHAECNAGATTAETLLQLGLINWRRGNFDRSEQLLTKAQEISVDNQDIQFLAHCFIGLALVKTSLEKEDDAILSYKQAIKLSPKNIHLWNNLAGLYVKKDQLEQALSAFKNSIRINPDDAVAWYGLADILFQNGNVEEAIHAYKRTITLLPEASIENPNFDNRIPESNKRFILPWLRLAALYTKKYQYINAIEMYRKAVALDVDNAEIWNEMGTLYFKIGAYEEALNAFSKAIEHNLENGKTYLNLACAYLKLGRVQDSIPHFIKSTEMLSDRQDRELASNLLEKAISEVKKGNSIDISAKGKEIQFSSTVEDVTWFYYKYNEEFTSNNLSFPVYRQENAAAISSHEFLKSNARNLIVKKNDRQTKKGEGTMLGQFPPSPLKQIHPRIKHKSEETSNTTTENSDPTIWIEKGNLHFQNTNYKEAIISYNHAIEISPSFGKPYHNLALIHFIQGDFDEAILLYQESIGFLNTDHEKAIAWNGLGNAYRCKKDYANAVLAYQRASEMDKENGGVVDEQIIFEVSEEKRTANFWNELGMLLFKTGAYTRAASAFRKSIDLEPSSGHSYSNLARVCTTQGQYKEALYLYRKSIDLITNERERANVWNRLGDVHRKLNDYDNALKAYQNATTLKNEKMSLLNRARLSLLSNRRAN